MRIGWALLAGLICLIIWLLRNAAGEMLKEEMQTRLCLIPNALIRIAILWLPERTYSEIVWLLMGRIVSTRANANRATGLPNSYARAEQR
jgi:hypothetical protein